MAVVLNSFLDCSSVYLFGLLNSLPHFYITSGRIKCQADCFIITLDIVDWKLSCSRRCANNSRTIYRPEYKCHRQHKRH